MEDWAAWKYYCRHLRAAVQYFDILHMHSRKRWETHLASHVIVTFVAINKINKYSHELSSKLLNVARRNSNPVILQLSGSDCS